ncbi:MAG TPA: amidohydrolase family protein, partial [Pirellulaceae bacterium]|nr:amidohydrolase family protein [Pirellulaceae bacterium]
NEAGDLLLLAGLLQRAGFSPTEVLQTVTSNAASVLGVADRVGQLAVGLDADFVVLSGDPFQRGTQVLATYVDGESSFSADAKTTGTRPIVVRAGAIHTTHGPWNDAAIVVTGSSIAAVGPDVSYPLDAEVFTFPGAVVVPGFIDLHAELGLGGGLRDRVELNTALANLIVSDDEAVQWVRQSGVTTVLVGSSRLPTPMMAIKLSDRPRVVKDPAALRFEISGNLTTAEATLRRTLTQGKAYADQWTKYEADYAEYQRALAAYEAAQKAAESSAPAQQESGQNQESGGANPNQATAGTTNHSTAQDSEKPAEEKKADGPEKPTEPTKPRAVPNLEPYRQVFAGKLPLMVVAQQANAIELTVRIAVDEFHLPTVIAGADEADLALDSLRRDGVAVAVGPSLIGRRGERTVNVPQNLATARIPFGFQSGAATGSSRLPAAAGLATYRGLGVTDALRGAAEDPARFLQLGSIGKLEAGYDADLVVLSGPPFDLGTEVLAVMIDGQWVYQKEPK